MAADPFASLKTAFPDLRITSQFRTPDRNSSVGGVNNSYHLTGQAIDIGTPTAQQYQNVKSWAAQNGMEVIGGYGDKHIHVEPAGNAPRSMVDLFSDQYKKLTGTATLAGLNPLAGAIYGALPDTASEGGGMFSGITDVVNAWPRILLIMIGMLIMGLGIFALVLNSGTALAEKTLDSDTGKNIARLAKLVV